MCKPKTCNRKATIQPFVFLNLAAEIRLEIYKHLVVAPAPEAPEDWNDWDKSHFGRGRITLRNLYADEEIFNPIQQIPEVNIYRTCRQIYNEAINYFYSMNKIECYLGDIARYGQRPMPKGLKANRVKHFRTFMFADPVGAVLYVDSSPCFAMEAMETMQICFGTRDFPLELPDFDETHWKKSTILTGLMCEFIKWVPKSVSLTWGPWEGLCDYNPKLRRMPHIISSKILEEVAEELEPMRGTAVLRYHQTQAARQLHLLKGVSAS
jgi:hypothetical protein